MTAMTDRVTPTNGTAEPGEKTETSDMCLGFGSRNDGTKLERLGERSSACREDKGKYKT
jgi:hypothetical protein